MRTVKDRNELIQNMDTLDRYLREAREPNLSFAMERLRRGTCFVAKKTDSGYRFYPSRFVGYADNTKDRHENNDTKDGRITNSAISSILGMEPKISAELEKFYREYCRNLGIMVRERGSFGVERKYWHF